MPLTSISAHTDEKVKESFDNLYKVSEDNDILKFFMEVWTSTDYSKAYTSVEWIEPAQFFDESGSLQKAELPEGYKVTSEAAEYWQYMETTKKEMLNTKDEDTLVKSYENKKVPALVSSLHFLRRTEAFKLLNFWLKEATDPNVKKAPDGKPIFWEHKFKSSTQTFNNKTNIKAWEEAIDFLEKYAWDLVDSRGKPLPCDFNLILVRKWGDASKKFRKLFWKEGMKATKISDVNIYNDWKYTVLESQYIESGDTWFAFDTSKDKPLILDDIQKPTLDANWESFQRIPQKWIHSATGSMRIVCANLPFYAVGSTWDKN